ncbi:hypothetical protein [Chitinophaga sp. sic0106]|uniref:hypothetical protein n=1 Tax=Chitinophaga sp. sic0106 TaxID=2854785 RepID=UPI001C48CA6D|nr:hypothetical protein [Chitinophaga sp. sic0106]MBV7532504.1 hypothetical protein [Chitinophaga sp. sic0106]
MSFDVQLFRTETMEKEQQRKIEGFFDNPANLEPFTEEQFQGLKERLGAYEFNLINEAPEQLQYKHPEYNLTALLTKTGLYFTAGWDEESVFEAGMTASEFADSDEFKKYDPQNGGWEVF